MRVNAQTFDPLRENRSLEAAQLVQQRNMISFIIPAHDAQASLARTLEAIHKAARAVGQPYEREAVAHALSCIRSVFPWSGPGQSPAAFIAFLGLPRPYCFRMKNALELVIGMVIGEAGAAW